MFDGWFDARIFDRLLEAVMAHGERWLIILLIGLAAYLWWSNRWQTRYLRRMKETFLNANLYVKPKKVPLFPVLLSASDREDELFYVFRFRLQPGMTVKQFEEKQKIFESAFHAETRVFGKGAIVTIKVKKEGYPT